MQSSFCLSPSLAFCDLVQERAPKRAKVDFSFDGFSAGGVATFLRYLYNPEAVLPAACDARLPRLRSAVRLAHKVCGPEYGMSGFWIVF